MKNRDKTAILDSVNSAIIALNDWSRITAPEYYNENDVQDSKSRVYSGGTLFYIATVLGQLREAKDLMESKNDQDSN